MTEKQLIELLKQFGNKKITTDDIVAKLKSTPFNYESSEFINIDHHRQLRQGLPEVIYGESKTVKQILRIAEKLSKQTYPILFTRLKKKQIKKLKEQYPEININKDARTATLNQPQPKTPKKGESFVLIVSAGTSDFRIVEEVKEVCITMEIPFKSINDVGVSGVHRLLKQTKTLQEATAIVVIAGMEGALASVVGGLVSSPIFAVPTSVGYGTNFGGVAALLSMLNSCAPGVTVTNIDNGFTAAVAACRVVAAVNKNK